MIFFEIRSNQTIKYGEKLRKLIYLERKLKVDIWIRVHRIKKIELGSRFAKKSSSKVDRNFRTKLCEKPK